MLMLVLNDYKIIKRGIIQSYIASRRVVTPRVGPIVTLPEALKRLKSFGASPIEQGREARKVEAQVVSAFPLVHSIIDLSQAPQRT